MNASESFRPATNYMLISNFSDIMWTIAKRLAMGSGIVVKIYIYIYMGSGVCYALRGPLSDLNQPSKHFSYRLRPRNRLFIFIFFFFRLLFIFIYFLLLFFSFLSFFPVSVLVRSDCLLHTQRAWHITSWVSRMHICLNEHSGAFY